jgi:hypothetical protein
VTNKEIKKKKDTRAEQEKKEKENKERARNYGQIIKKN